MAQFLASAMIFMAVATNAGAGTSYVNELGLPAASYRSTCITYPNIPVFVGQPQFNLVNGDTGTVSDIHWVSVQGVHSAFVGYFVATLEDRMIYFYSMNTAIFTFGIGYEPLDLGEVDDMTLTEALYRKSLVKKKNLTFFVHDCFSKAWDGPR